MPSQLTADDIIPLVGALTPQERTRLLRLIARPQSDDASLYHANPPSNGEFCADEEPLAWEGAEWDNVP
jgi:hypothetical protein